MQRKRNAFNRRAPKLIPRERVLIVCEGEKTEPFYFSELAQDLGLAGTHVKVCGKECGSDPMSVVRYAYEIAKDDGAYDRVFCVIDRDKHTNLNAALSFARSAKLRGTKSFKTALSIPSFEYWLLLHYRYYDSPFSGTGKHSVAMMCLRELKKDWPDYEKSTRGVYHAVKEETSVALDRATRRRLESKNAGSDNPTTEVDIVVALLQAIAKSAK
jgi:hypothetical protein